MGVPPGHPCGLTAWFGTVGNVAPPEAVGLPVVARMASKRGKSAIDGTDPRPMWFVVVYVGAVVLATYKVRQLTGGLMLRRMVRPPKDLVRLKG